MLKKKNLSGNTQGTKPAFSKLIYDSMDFPPHIFLAMTKLQYLHRWEKCHIAIT